MKFWMRVTRSQGSMILRYAGVVLTTGLIYSRLGKLNKGSKTFPLDQEPKTAAFDIKFENQAPA